VSEVADVNYGLLPGRHSENEYQEVGPEATGRPSGPVS
jgi:hypothetical protein